MKQIFFALIISILLVGCGGSKEVAKNVDLDETPVWFNELPNDPNYLFAAATATSKDMQLAVDKAAADGRAAIGQQMELKVEVLQKKFAEETGIGEDAQFIGMFTQATKNISSSSISGSRIDKRKTMREGNIFRAYVLISSPIGAANQALIDQLKKNELIYTRLKETKAFDELEKETEKLDASKK